MSWLLLAAALNLANVVFVDSLLADEPERLPLISDRSGEYSGAAQPITAPEIYGQGVRETDWRSPDEERAGFHLPPGFRVDLFAAEPQIAKPLNMAWDTRGRLWVSNTVEYPYPAAEGSVARDSIKILEDTNGDGRADKVLTFADGLNIPMGLIPVHDGVICFSIPYIWHLKDTDGDDRVDERIRLLGPFDTTRDTHGMVNALRRGADGWIYACHGFNNQSNVTAADGSSVSLVSGNIFRFREDGSSVELFTSGQVNPFGMTQDEYGHWYTADCHSKPITALIQGGCYPSFGRPHDGLGFAPSMMDHLHGSTAISGLCYYRGPNFPAAYRGLLYSGNVMTSRINCNRLVWQGATATAVELPDFLTSDDPWFRPVDIRLGPEGDLFVADFYNKIIGHYEVPLTHPGRDRTSGRIWRISYVGSESDSSVRGTQPSTVRLQEVPQQTNEAAAANDERVDALAVSPLQRSATIERLVVDPDSTDQRLKQRMFELQPAEVIAYLQVLQRRAALDSSVIQHVVERVSGLEEEGLKPADELPLSVLWCDTCLMAQHWPSEWQAKVLALARQLLISRSGSPHVARAATELIGGAGNVDDIDLLLECLTDWQDDPTLRQVARIAIRNLLRATDDLPRVLERYRDSSSSGEDIGLPHDLASVLCGVASTDAAVGLLQHLVAADVPKAELTSQAIQLLNEHPPRSVDQLRKALRFIRAISEGSEKLYAGHLADLAERYSGLRSETHYSAASRALAQEIGVMLRKELLPALEQRLGDIQTNSWMDRKAVTWPLQVRPSEDGELRKLMSSHALGEAYTGVLTSESFPCPASIRFWIAGHNGDPAKADQGLCRIRLREIASGLELKSAAPPRNDTARLVTWDTSEWLGKSVKIEVVDQDSGGAYAWLAVGDFEPPELNRNDLDTQVQALLTLLETGVVEDMQGELGRLLDRLRNESRIRTSILAALARGERRPLLQAIIDFAVRLDQPSAVENDFVEPGAIGEERTQELAEQLCAVATVQQQAQLVRRLADSAAGCNLMDNLLAKGVLSPDAVAELDVEQLPGSLATEVRQRLATAIASAAVPEEAIDLAALLASLDWSSVDTQRGQQIFVKQCANCHQLGGEGKLVGPQLDGAIVRSYQRLLQDILLPNKNVDLAFRQSAYLLQGDVVLVGLGQPQANDDVVLTFQDGTTRRISAEQILDRKQLANSLMPDNFRELLSNSDLASLLQYMVSQRAVQTSR